MKRFLCPRRDESYFGSSPAFARDNDYDPSDDTCRYCGSLDPSTFMQRIEAGTVQLGTTDKNYKVYVNNDGGESFKQSFRDCYNAPDKDANPCNDGPDKCTHWVTKETNHTKFYFQHLSEHQMERFIELLNAKKLKFQGGYGFYVLPFFCTRKEEQP